MLLGRVRVKVHQWAWLPEDNFFTAIGDGFVSDHTLYHTLFILVISRITASFLHGWSSGCGYSHPFIPGNSLCVCVCGVTMPYMVRTDPR